MCKVISTSTFTLKTHIDNRCVMTFIELQVLKPHAKGTSTHQHAHLIINICRLMYIMRYIASIHMHDNGTHRCYLMYA